MQSINKLGATALPCSTHSKGRTESHPHKVSLVFHYMVGGEIEPDKYEREGWFLDPDLGIKWWVEYIAEDMLGMEIPDWVIDTTTFGKTVDVKAHGDDGDGGRDQVICGKITIE